MFEQIKDEVVLLLTMIKSTRKSKTQISNTETAKTEPVKFSLVKTENRRKPEPAKAVPSKADAPRPAQVCLELIKPGAKSVYVAGSFNQWKPDTTPLVQAGNGRWVGNLAVRPGRHEYLFVVDGQWLPDPNAKENVQNPFGGLNSVFTVSE
jgi:1,4-alpha-glucan branching enzyme